MSEQQHAFTEPEAARYVRASPSALRLWRFTGEGPRFYRAGKLVRYRRVDLDEWIESRLSDRKDSATPAQQLERQIS